MKELKELLNKKHFFKLILGLGNKSLEDIKKISALYAKAGADMFDLTPDKLVYEALYEGIRSQNLNPEDFLFCVSFSIGDDKHGKKAKISQKKCTKCLKCIKNCPYSAIKFYNEVHIIEEKCIGCQKCECTAISYSKNNADIKKTIDTLKDYKIDCIELHVSGAKEQEIIEEFNKIKKFYPEIEISICLSREKFSDKKLLKIVAKLIELSKDKITIQADGISISGGKDDYTSSLQAVSTAQLIQNFDAYLLLSGGCNSKTLELAEACNVDANGVSIGSYGRLLVSEEVNNPEFWYNDDVFNSAFNKAQNLVNTLKATE